MGWRESETLMTLFKIIVWICMIAFIAFIAYNVHFESGIFTAVISIVVVVRFIVGVDEVVYKIRMYNRRDNKQD